ncbi:hypothetical protein WJX73_004836 [Symbiochloris irregularis]|uniref:Uncharacterized protein n=1 Tax=Symbiochloris irregularis TaxID=706552 RepID=A0AAW1PI78_9CHLO
MEAVSERLQKAVAASGHTQLMHLTALNKLLATLSPDFVSESNLTVLTCQLLQTASATPANDAQGAGNSGRDQASDATSQPHLPPEMLFSTIGGDPSPPEQEQQQAAEHFRDKIAAVITSLEQAVSLHKLAGLPMPLPESQQSSSEAAVGASGGLKAGKQPAKARVLIEEIPSETPGLPQKPFPKAHADGQKLEAYKGPGTFARTVAARQLAWCVTRMGYRQIEEVIGSILPCVLAAVEDASPPVQCMGLRAMHHLAMEALPATLAWQKDMLLYVAKRSIMGCDARVWKAAAPTATALVRSLCGAEAFSQGYSTIMAEMLQQGERFAHQLDHRLVWLKAMPTLIQGMGLATVRSKARPADSGCGAKPCRAQP